MGTILTWPLANENSAVLQLTSLHEGPYSDKLPLMLGLPGTTHVHASTLRIQSYGSKSPFSPLYIILYLDEVVLIRSMVVEWQVWATINYVCTENGINNLKWNHILLLKHPNLQTVTW